MTDLGFVPHDEPQTDFVIIAHDSDHLRERMLALGATALVRRNYTAYLWNSRLGDRFLLGMGVLDGQFLVGPRRLEKLPTRLGAGTYVIVELGDDGTRIQPDLFGMSPVYASQGFVTNRLHLAGIISGQVDVDNALSSTYNDGGFSFSFNTFRTPIKGVSLVPAGARVELRSGHMSVITSSDENDFRRTDPENYWKLIERGAREVIDNVTAVVDSGLPVFADITGGRDSRVVFGALVAAGRQKNVIFNTIADPRTPGLKADLEIGTGLVAKYGGSYAERPRAIGFAETTVEQNLRRRRSQLFGSYHWITPSDVRPVSTLTRTQTIRMLGGGGELYRDYWQPMLFTSVDSDAEGDDVLIEQMLRTHVGKALGRSYLDRYLPDMLATFQELPGKSIGHKLDAHYLNFRNRFHFGLRQSLPETMTSLNVATVPSLLTASRSLPASDRASGRVLFDVIRIFDEKLAYLPFDSPGDPRIFSSPYHRQSKYDLDKLSLEPAVHLAKGIADKRGFQRPSPPKASSWDFNSLLDSEISRSVDLLSSSSSFSFLVDDKLDSYIDWAQNHSPRNRSALASKLRALADYSQL